MSNNYKDPAFKQWLDKLQQESWQLELIISGFAIYGLFVAFGPLLEMATAAQNDQMIYKFIASSIGMIACSILLFNLLLHVILRGLWIGALGLRYVSGDIEYDKLKYSKKFTNYLEKRVGSFDKYIATLEDYCSVLFAISFLLIFYFLGIVLSCLCIVLCAVFLMDDEIGSQFLNVLGTGLVLFIMLGMLITLIDFVGQGILKKNKWVSKVYFPIYWVFSFLTLSFLYRPLVYNFLDNRFGKRLVFTLIPFYTGIIILASLEYKTSNYFTGEENSSDYFSNSRNYEDQLNDGDDFVRVASVQSKVISDPYVQVFVVYTENVENHIFNFNKALEPEEDQRGMTSSINLTSNGANPIFVSGKRDSIRRAYLKTFNDTHEIVIDSVSYKGDFIISTNNKGQLGFESYINSKTLAEGKHLLKVRRLRIRKQDTTMITRVSIPFWYFKNP